MAILSLRDRRLEPEWLDLLPADNPRARRSRRDLRTVNWLMGHRRILRGALLDAARNAPPDRLAELGAGDGTLTLGLARDLHSEWPSLDVELVDQQALAGGTLAAFERLGWRARQERSDLFAWAGRSRGRRVGIVLANLVLHHFEDARLRALFADIAACAQRFIALEPRRSLLALAGSAGLGLIGCNDVTRHDARVSVRAGFRDGELSRLWPRAEGWALSERPAGMFSQLFVAARA